MTKYQHKGKSVIKRKKVSFRKLKQIGNICQVNVKHNKTAKKPGGTTSKRQKPKHISNVKTIFKGIRKKYPSRQYAGSVDIREDKNLSEKINEFFVQCM